MSRKIAIIDEAAGVTPQNPVTRPETDFYGTFNSAPAPTLAQVLTAGNAAGTKKITGVVDPAADQDAATKKYVDTQVASLPPAPAYEAWSASASYTVTNTDRDTCVECTASQGNGTNFNLYTGAPAGRRVMLLMSPSANGMFNDNHFNLGGGVTFKKGGTSTTVTTLVFGTNISPTLGNAVLLFICRGSDTWACFVLETPHKSDGTFSDINFA